jgi:hypothetical protein
VRLADRSRWLVLAGLLCVVWLMTPNPVPLYDGIGFPDEPYRYVGATPAPTTAQVTLPVKGGANTGGLFANSAELGPQVSLFAPPRAFAVSGTAPVVVKGRAVAAAPPPPPGTIDSNVYAVSFTSAAGPVTLVADAQPPAITLRSASQATSGPVLAYRADPAAPWRELKTRRVGRDIYNALVPGPGQFVLVKPAQTTPRTPGGRGALYVVIGATVLLMAAVLVGVRLLSRRQP